MVSGFSDYRSPVGMANENCRSVLRCKSSLGNCYVVLQRYRRILDDADAVAVSFQDLVDALPASAIHKATMDENDVLHGSIPPSFGDAAYIGGTRFRTVQQALSVWLEFCGQYGGLGKVVTTTPESLLRACARKTSAQ